MCLHQLIYHLGKLKGKISSQKCRAWILNKSILIQWCNYASTLYNHQTPTVQSTSIPHCWKMFTNQLFLSNNLHHGIIIPIIIHTCNTNSIYLHIYYIYTKFSFFLQSFWCNVSIYTIIHHYRRTLHQQTKHLTSYIAMNFNIFFLYFER